MTPDLNRLEPNWFLLFFRSPFPRQLPIHLTTPQKPTHDVTHNHKHTDVTSIHHVLHYTRYCPSAMTRSCGVDVNKIYS